MSCKGCGVKPDINLDVSREFKASNNFLRVLCVVLAICLFLTVCTAGILLIRQQERFLNYLEQYDFISYEQDGQNNVQGKGNDVTYGTDLEATQP